MIKRILNKIYEPLYYNLYRRDNGLKYYNFYKKAQWNSLEENKKIQAKMLYELVKYSYENIPYYKKVIKKNRITFSEKTIFNDIKKFPVLTKEIIKKEFDNIHKIKSELKWYYNTSGGSTGEPVKFIQDWNFEAQSEAITKLQYYWCNYKSGERFVQLWGSQKDIFQQKENLKHRFANWIKSVTLLNAFNMNDEKINTYVSKINKQKPKLILAYAQSINELSTFIKKNNLKVHKPNAIMTSAGILYPYMKENIESTFKCPVFNRYGSREVGNIACECEKHEGLHLSIFTHYLEILNDKLQPCKEGESGEIYITLLTNYTMPLIRYKIGDIATYTEKKCTCKRGLPLIKNIVGRNNDLFITKKGEKIHTGIINMQFYFKEFIDKYQVIQKRPDKLLIKIVLSKESKKYKINKELSLIETKLKKIMGEDCKINFEIVKKIDCTKSGKYRYTIREF